mmetsp:Transcript_18461/g.52755  ORF Transcript_18461/g.52755 Transcript_18461/m.52755 type:complete len:282 (+) Transcript_18461:791-1636(+)
MDGGAVRVVLLERMDCFPCIVSELADVFSSLPPCGLDDSLDFFGPLEDALDLSDFLDATERPPPTDLAPPLIFFERPRESTSSSVFFLVARRGVVGGGGASPLRMRSSSLISLFICCCWCCLSRAGFLAAGDAPEAALLAADMSFFLTIGLALTACLVIGFFLSSRSCFLRRCMLAPSSGSGRRSRRLSSVGGLTLGEASNTVRECWCPCGRWFMALMVDARRPEGAAAADSDGATPAELLDLKTLRSFIVSVVFVFVLWLLLLRCLYGLPCASSVLGCDE